MRSRVSIGEFSRASQLTVKTLRHYHQVGLLEPSEVDLDTGYRYYSEEQIPVAQVIRRLRTLEMPVADVKSVLAAADPDSRNRLIVDHLERLEGELTRTRAAVTELRNLLDQRDPPLAVEHRTVPPTPALAIQDTVAREDILAWWQGALGELAATLQGQGVRPAGPSGGLYASEIFQYGRGQATVFIPADRPVRAVGRTAPLVIPAAELAIARHHGSLTDGDITYGQLGAYVIKHEIGIDAPLREHYLHAFLETTNADDWETEIGWPVFRTRD